jgi:hypothetical protein
VGGSDHGNHHDGRVIRKDDEVETTKEGELLVKATPLSLF